MHLSPGKPVRDRVFTGMSLGDYVDFRDDVTDFRRTAIRAPALIYVLNSVN